MNTHFVAQGDGPLAPVPGRRIAKAGYAPDLPDMELSEGVTAPDSGNAFTCHKCDSSFPSEKGLQIHVGRSHKE